VARVGTTAQPVVVMGPTTAPPLLQVMPVGYLQSGCGWATTIRFTVDSKWAAGLYAVRLAGPNGMVRDVPFVVRPATSAARNSLALILPTNTYNAYNDWGGHSNYCADMESQQVQLTFDRPSRQQSIEATGISEHTLWSDVMLLQWLASQSLAVDIYPDIDVHQDPALLVGYKGVVLGSHPEYWTETARQGLVDYLAGGGRLLCAGGNAIYSRVRYDDATHSLSFRTPDTVNDLYADAGLPESLILGVNFQAASMHTYASFKVATSPDHPVLGPLLAGTGLVKGSEFGKTGYNGPASGWELNGFLGWPGEYTAADVVAVGNNSVAPAQMVFRPTKAGGFVYSASSISFNAALSSDAAMSKLLRNVFDLALAAPAPTLAKAPATKVAPQKAQREKEVSAVPPS
jgi:N,N-dimethylformamidase